MSTIKDSSEPRYLQYLLTNLFPDDRYSICIQDTSGVLHTIPSLQIDYTKYRTHTGPICTAAKLTSKGLNYCARMKAVSLNRFKAEDRAFPCRCHLGLTEVTKPVYQGNKLACAIYIGSFILEGQKQEVLRRVKKYCSLFGTEFEIFRDAVEATPVLSPAEVENLLNLAESVAKYIELLLDTSRVKLMETSKKNHVNKSTSEGTHWAVAFALEYIDFHFSKDINLKVIAKQLFINPDYLCRIFRKHTGYNFIDYLNAKRIREAKRIIAQSKVSITDISHDVGFNNKSHFNRIFKKLCGVTPSEYKKNHDLPDFNNL